MRALGAHTYMGVMQVGVSRVDGVEVVGSAESWERGIRARAAGRGVHC